jgi:hypothetical protein
MRNLTLTIQFCDISQSFVSATKYENTSRYLNKLKLAEPNNNVNVDYSQTGTK